MNNCMNGFTEKVANALRSRRLYWAIIGFFVFEALWVAFSARYPMAFDEDFHLGVIKIYSQHWLPFLSGQPEGGNAFGALAADPSYLYHYLMSFPYRLISLFTDSQTAHVIFLRLINVAMVTSGVVLFGKVLAKSGASRLLTNGATLLFALIPTVPLLAGQINYDNLIILLLAWACLLLYGITKECKTRTINLKSWSMLLVALMLSCLVKYAFLPIALAAAVYLVFMIWRTYRGRFKTIGNQLEASYARLSTAWKVCLVVALSVSAVLFAQRYVVNIVAYGDPVPDCAKVISVDSCMEYSPWARNHLLAASKGEVDPNPIAYTWIWMQGLHYRMFFMVNGPPLYTNYPPAPLPSAVAIVILLTGTMALVFYRRQVFGGQPFLLFLFWAPVVYAGFLWAMQTYPQYLSTGQPVAINGRYFIPLLFPMAAVLGRGLSIALRAWPHARAWSAAVILVLFLQGGGVFSFILRSDPDWYWPNQAVVTANQAAQDVLRPIIFIGPKHY